MSDYSNSEIPNGSYYADVAVLAEIFAKRYGTSVDAAYEWFTKDVEVPPADVQPVVHGEWIFNPDGMDWNIPAWVCSECHGKNDMIPTYIQGKDKMIKVEHPLRWAGSKYCPNCGAKMDGKGADE